MTLQMGVDFKTSSQVISTPVVKETISTHGELESSAAKTQLAAGVKFKIDTTQKSVVKNSNRPSSPSHEQKATLESAEGRLLEAAKQSGKMSKSASTQLKAKPPKGKDTDTGGLSVSFDGKLAVGESQRGHALAKKLNEELDQKSKIASKKTESTKKNTQLNDSTSPSAVSSSSKEREKFAEEVKKFQKDLNSKMDDLQKKIDSSPYKNPDHAAKMARFKNLNFLLNSKELKKEIDRVKLEIGKLDASDPDDAPLLRSLNNNLQNLEAIKNVVPDGKGERYVMKLIKDNSNNALFDQLGALKFISSLANVNTCMSKLKVENQEKHQIYESYNLNDSEKISLYLYTTSAYVSINDDLRKNNGKPTHPAVKLITENALSGMSKIDDFQELDKNGESKKLKRAVFKEIPGGWKEKHIVLGKSFKDNAFMSTTTTANAGGWVNLLFNNTINAKDIGPFSAFPGEQEILVLPGTEYLIVDTGEKGGPVILSPDLLSMAANEKEISTKEFLTEAAHLNDLPKTSRGEFAQKQSSLLYEKAAQKLQAPLRELRNEVEEMAVELKEMRVDIKEMRNSAKRMTPDNAKQILREADSLEMQAHAYQMAMNRLQAPLMEMDKDFNVMRTLSQEMKTEVSTLKAEAASAEPEEAQILLEHIKKLEVEAIALDVQIEMLENFGGEELASIPKEVFMARMLAANAIEIPATHSLNQAWKSGESTHLSRLDSGVIKGGNVHVEKKTMEDGSCKLHVDFKMSRFAREHLRHNVQMIKENLSTFEECVPEELKTQQDGGKPTAHVSIGKTEYRFLKKGTDGKYLEKGGYVAASSNSAEEIVFKGIGRVVIVNNPKIGALYNDISLELDEGVENPAQAAQMIMSLLGLGPTFLSQSPQDEERIKVAQIFRSLYPAEAHKIEYEQDYFEKSVDTLKAKIIEAVPDMEKQFQKYLVDEPHLMQRVEIHPGKEIWGLADTKERMREAGALGLMIGVAGYGEGSRMERAARALSGMLAKGALSTKDRMQQGLIVRGGSTEDDFASGGAEGAFMRIVHQKHLEERIEDEYCFSGDVQIIVTLEVTNHGCYGYVEDKFGIKNPAQEDNYQHYANRSSLPELAKAVGELERYKGDKEGFEKETEEKKRDLKKCELKYKKATIKSAEEQLKQIEANNPSKLFAINRAKRQLKKASKEITKNGDIGNFEFDKFKKGLQKVGFQEENGKLFSEMMSLRSITSQHGWVQNEVIRQGRIPGDKMIAFNVSGSEKERKELIEWLIKFGTIEVDSTLGITTKRINGVDLEDCLYASEKFSEEMFQEK